MFKRSTRALFGLGVVAVTGLLLTFAGPAVAHHPFAMAEGGDMNALQGLISGIGHPLLGPDHLLFLLAIGLIGLRRPVAWVLPLLAFALGGAVLTQIFPLPSSLAPAAEVLVSLTLAVEGLIALNIIPAGILLPVIGLHGYLLGGAIVGAESTPLFTYFLGLLIAQGALLLAVSLASKRLLDALGAEGKRVAAGIWIGIGGAFAWAALVA
ncbi:hydrogenase/urease accessory protein [Synechococcus sp. SYN20]|uniref:HupE/UreJ family protein n=1 Tax=unclassified Synechococcus TaxID=2626047 RepID=UPI00164822B4|nr:MULTISPECIES: HupE/UreJ family protein [unclassified Synechococcus]MDA9868191.1 HupE/UreJ family protein [Synechococcus sp. AH-224-I15]MDB4683309.1 HupE/UreJ family protein [bacterium]QNI76838.1 hydrogenase/urease accessory protein [Synechococcus sp. MVIR-18-1]QNJ26489.1 hydrogenase/urease accessory protein [Synechococcus sp. SYN20]